jgi:hypothetical protein
VLSQGRLCRYTGAYRLQQLHAIMYHTQTLRCDTHTHLEADRHDGLKLSMRDALHVRNGCVREVRVRHIGGLRVPAPDARLPPAHTLHAAHYLYTKYGVRYVKDRRWAAS